MTHISKHDSKLEGESDTSENCGVDFFIIWHTISINDLLKGPDAVITSERGGRCKRGVVNYIDLRSFDIFVSWQILDRVLNILDLEYWSPEEADEQFFPCFQHIQLMI